MTDLHRHILNRLSDGNWWGRLALCDGSPNDEFLTLQAVVFLRRHGLLEIWERQVRITERGKQELERT